MEFGRQPVRRYGAGGADNGGTIFELAKTNGTYASTVTTLYSFTGGSDGAFPTVR